VYRSTVTHTFAAFGQFIVRLTVTDSEGLTNSKSKTILIIAPPTASFSWSSYPKAHEPITFNGSSSTANGGVIVNYRWDFGDGNITNVANSIIVHTYLASGNFNVNLTVTDSEGLSGTAAITINVATAVAPRADFTFSPSSPYVFQVVNFDASASTPGTGSALNYQWNFGDGNITSTAVPSITHVYRTSGNFTVSLTVRNIAGLSDSTSKPAAVLPISGPKADFSWSPSVPLPNRTVTFDGSASAPGWNGSIRPPIVTWRWNFGDGNITQVNTATIVHVFTSPNDFMVTLTVTDINGSTGSTTKTVKVSSLIGDLNGDGKVDIKDLAIAAKAYGSAPGMPSWNPIADMNGDLKIDIKDLSIIAKHYGETSMSLFIPFTRSTSYAVPY
jgi:PKD repeat protein